MISLCQFHPQLFALAVFLLAAFLFVRGENWFASPVFCDGYSEPNDQESPLVGLWTHLSLGASTSVSAKGAVGGGNIFNAAPLFGNNYFPSGNSTGESSAGAEGSVLEPAATSAVSSLLSSSTVVIALVVLFFLGLAAYFFHHRK
jgi:hypothetical protein